VVKHGNGYDRGAVIFMKNYVQAIWQIVFNEFNVLRLRRERAEQSNKESYFFHVLNMV
jgi:hypothetical protein